MIEPGSPPPPRRAGSLEVTLFLLGFAVYAITRFVGVTNFPIYFFCDEALQANLAGDLVQNGFRDQYGTLLPPYFLNDKRWDLSLSVYLHALPVTALGKSVLVTRGTEAVVNLLAPVGLAAALRFGFASPAWWAAPFVLAVIPTWFLHSRTAFQPAMTATFFACFIAAYLLYRLRSGRWIFAALLFGAATFYSYTAGQGLALVTAILLLILDWRYHLSQPRKRIAAALALVALLAAPYVRYRVLHPQVVADQLRVLNSYWIQPLPLEKKLQIFAKNYVSGFRPSYWFAPDRYELERHRMKGMGFLPVSLVPFALAGFLVCVRRFRSPAHRVALVVPLGVPFSAAAAAIGIMRVLSMVVPFSLYACLGLGLILAWLRGPRLRIAFATTSAAVLTATSAWILRTALVDGPTWYRNYGLYGMQYGSRQVFGAVREGLKSSPEARFRVSPVWSNNPEAFLPYFLKPHELTRAGLGNLDGPTQEKKDIDPRVVYVLTPAEYQAADSSGKFVLRTHRVIPYPDGTPGFYFVSAGYSNRIDELLAADEAERRRLVEETALLQGEQVRVRHSVLDMGEFSNALDGKRETLFRGKEANPIVIEFEFPRPRSVSGVALDLGSMDFQLRIELQPADGAKPLVFTGEFKGLPSDPHVDISLPRGSHRASRVRIEVLNIHTGLTSQTHVREIVLR